MDILCEISSDYKAYVTMDKRGVKHLLLRFHNSLYRTMVEIMIYYRKFTKSLTGTGFDINLYDPCVANKVINGSHMKICFHVDDCKMSHSQHKDNDCMTKRLSQEYEIIFEDGSGHMSVIQVKVHEYLGMTLDQTVCGKVRIVMFSYIEDILNSFDKAHPKGNGAK